MKTVRKPSSSIFFMVICIFSAHPLAESKYHDVCIQEAEAVNLRCGPGQIIQVNSAKYGRMRTGRCIQRDNDMGCDTDILFLLDRWCSGKKDCHMAVPNKELVDANQCPNDMLMYLEYDADCVAVAEADGSECRSERKYKAATNEGTLASLTVDQTGCGSTSSPWTIEGAPGQRVNISMLDFAYAPTSSGAKASTMICEPYGYIVERKLGINRTVCGGVARRSHVYMSASSAVEIYINAAGMRTASSSFILNYAVIGCPDARPPDHAWYKRTGDTAEMGCEWSDLSWKMICSGNRWIGSMGNCSVARSAEVAAKKEDFNIHPVLSMGLIIGLAALILILVCVIGFGFYCMKKREAAPDVTNTTLMRQPEHFQQCTTLRNAAQSFPTNPRQTMLTGRPHQYVPGKTDGATSHDLLHGWDTKTANRGQHGTKEGEYLAPCLTGSYLAEKYGAPIYDTVGTRNGTGERNSSAGDGDWVQEANFQFLTPQV